MVIALAVAVLLGLATAARASIGAVGQYGRPPRAAPSLPGFSTVLTSVTVTPAGATIGPVNSDGAAFTLTVPPGAFPENVQITLTSGNLATLTPAALTGYAVIAALGVQVELNGAPYPGTFLMPLALTGSDSRFTAASLVGIWDGSSLVPFTNASSAAGVVTISFDSDPDFAVQSPTSQAQQQVPKATQPVTGKPVAGEGILAAVLLAIGLGGLTVRRRRRGLSPAPAAATRGPAGASPSPGGARR